MEKLFINILNMSISASYLILAVLVVRFLLRKAPKTMRGFLWLLVGIRLLFPFSIESAFSLIPNTQTANEHIYDNVQQPLESPQTNIQNPLPVQMTAADTAVEPSVAAAAQTPAYLKICTEIWIAGMIIMTVYMAISWLGLSKRVRTAVPMEFFTSADREGTTKIYRSEQIDSPFLFGIIRPRIYIPSHIAAEDIPYVVLHERTHIKRKDYLIKPMGFLLLSVYWFNPLIWAAYVMLCKDIELICDELVVRRLGTQCKKAYSQALLTSSVNRRMIAACPVAFGEISVKERVKNVLNYKKPAFWVIMAAVLACIIVPVCFMTQKKDSDEKSVAEDSIEGEYYMDVSERGEYISVPKLTIAADGTFTFSYDALSSYLPQGTYTLRGNILKAETADGARHYQFTLTDGGYLVFNAGESSDVSQTNGADAPVKDGSGFTKTYPVELLNYAAYLSKNVEESQNQDAAMTEDELKKVVESIEEAEKSLASKMDSLQKQFDELEKLEKNQQEQELMQKYIQELQTSMEELEAEKQVVIDLLSQENAVDPYAEIEKWAQAFCCRDGVTMAKLANNKTEQDLEDRQLLIHGFDGEKDYVAFGWSSPWPWGGNYEEEAPLNNYRIINVADRYAEILYYAWVSDPHITVWREELTFRIENGNKFIITSETLHFMDSICTAEEFHQAYPDGFTGTMMDYVSFNEAGEALNENAKANRDSRFYEKLFDPGTAAVYLLNLLDNRNKVGVRIGVGSGLWEDRTDNSTCIVRIEFYEDGKHVDVEMRQPYGSDGIWLPYNIPDSAASENTSSILINSQNVSSIKKEDAKTLEALFPNHHEFTPFDGFSKTADLNGDGIAEKVELTNLGYNGGDGGYALKVTDTKTGKLIPLPDGYTEEDGFPLGTYTFLPDGQVNPSLRIYLGEVKLNEAVATITPDALINIYEPRWGDAKKVLFKENAFNTRVDAVSGCNIITYNNEETPALVLKSYVSGCMGHADTLGYVITELRLQKDNTWVSKHYFLLDSCGDGGMAQEQVDEAVPGRGGASVLPFDKDTEVNFEQLLPNNGINLKESSF